MVTEPNRPPSAPEGTDGGRPTQTAAEATRENEERYRLIVEAAKDYAILTTNPEGRIESWSPGAEAVFGWSAQEAIGRPLAMTFTEQDQAEDVPRRECEAAARDGATPDVRWHRRKDGGRVFIDGTARAMRDPAGELRGFLKIGQDQTDRKAMEQSLQDSDRRKDEFLAMLGHELRNPLAAVAAGIKVAASTKIAEARRLELLVMVDSQLAHVKRLVDDVMDVARMTQGQIQVNPEAVTLQEILRQAVGMADFMIRQKECELQLELPADPVDLQADPVRLTQVFVNLLTNAAKYGAGRPIAVSAAAEGAEAVVRVRDWGVGIAADLLPQVFKLFVQASHTMDRSDGGLGMGLSVVRRLVELHGGTAEAFSEGPGKGSEFVVRLPLPGSVIEANQS